MSDNVVELDCQTTLPVPSERLLRKAIENGVDDVIIIGFTEHGELYFASADPDVGHVMWQLELARKFLLDSYAPASATPDRAA